MVEVKCVRVWACARMQCVRVLMCSPKCVFEMFFTMANIPWYWPDVSSSRLIGLAIL